LGFGRGFDPRIPTQTLIDLTNGMLLRYDRNVKVKLSDLKPFASDPKAVDEILKTGDHVVYEYYENVVEGGFIYGVTIIYPGLIGEEYNFTRGHYHLRGDADEIYIGIKGKGLLLMQDKRGDFYSYPIERGYIVYIPGEYAHRTVNIGEEPLIFLYIYPANAGHDYESIKMKGFKKVILRRDGKPTLVDNPRYRE
jgi:glucose-6-phosphate isomerase